MTPEAMDLARPVLPRPNCRVMLVCGPPAAGKSTLVRDRAKPGDIVIDLDTIARERGLDRDRPASETGDLLRERNARLAALAREPPSRTAWVILGAPSASLRRWWSDVLNVRPGNLFLLVPTRDELRRRILTDPDRKYVTELHLALVSKWFTRERDDDPGSYQRGCDRDGFPTDPLHPWSR